MSVQLSIDEYFRTKSSISPIGTTEKRKVMKRYSLSLNKNTPVKLTKINEDVTIMENAVTTIDLISDEDSPGIVESITNTPTSTSSPTSSNQFNLTPKTPVKSENVNITKGATVIDLHSNDTSVETAPTYIKCRNMARAIYEKLTENNEPNTNLSQPSCSAPQNLTKSHKGSSILNNSSQSCDAGSSDSSTSTILYTPPLLTPQKKTQNFKSPTSSSKKYYSPNKKRTVVKRSPVKRSLAHNFDSTTNEDEVFNKACEGMDHKTIFLLSIINKCIKDDALKRLLDQQSQHLISRILHTKKPGSRTVCRMYWRQTEWYRVEQMKQVCVEKKNQIDESSYIEMLNDLTEKKLIACSNENNNNMTFEDYAKVLKCDEMKQICKDLKIKILSKQDAIERLRRHCQRSSISTYFTGTPSNNTKQVLDIMKTKAGLCYKLSDETRLALNKLYLLMYLGINYEAIRSKNLELMLTNEKYNIETYPVNKDMVLDNATVVFSNSDEFNKYYDAHVLYESYLSEGDTKKKCELINRVFKLYHDIPESEMLRYKLYPIWLHRFTSAYLYVKMLESGIQELKKDKQNETALDVVTCLISQFAFRQHKKAGWYAEKALILHKLFGFHNEAAEVLVEGLKSNLSFEAKDAMRKRADLIANQKNIEIDKHLKKELIKYASKELILENKFKADHINKQHIETNNQRGKKKFKVQTVNEDKYVDAEDYCVIYYTTEGPWTHAEHWEGRIITTIFFLLFWDIIYTKPRGVSGIFLSHYQMYPLDMFCESFYTNRKTLIDERLARIEDMTTIEMVDAMKCKWEERPEHEISGINRSIGWDNVRGVSMCLGARRTASVCRRLAEHYGYAHSGFPDLTLWNVHTNTIKFVEVKTDTDKPSMKQLQWIQYLTENGIDAGFCYLGVYTTRCKARAKESKDNIE